MIAKMDYVTKGVALAKIANTLSIDEEWLKQVAELEDWRRDRLDFVREIYDEVRESTKRSIISTFQNVVAATHKASAWATAAFEVQEGKVVVTEKVGDVLGAIRLSLQTLEYTMGDITAFSDTDKGIGRSEDEAIAEYEKELSSRATGEN